MSPATVVAVAGVDFGSDSVRVVVVDAIRGTELASASASYRRWASGKYSDPLRGRFRQHPLDYIEALEECFRQIAGEIDTIIIQSIAIDTTGSTVAPVDENGTPLALLEAHSEDPNCMFWLWKDHTASAEAVEITHALQSAGQDYTRYQGEYSSEWWWSKILRSVRESPELRQLAVSWVEHSDWMVALLTGVNEVRQIVRNACAAGHKQLYNSRLGGYIPGHVLVGIDPYLAEVAASITQLPLPAGSVAGKLAGEWAEALGLRPGIVVGVGSLDAHAGAVGAGIAPGILVKVMGTSTVDMFLTEYDQIGDADLRTVCGFAEDSIVPGKLGGESGQAAFGDLFAWFGRLLSFLATLRSNQDGRPPGLGRLLGELDHFAAERADTGITAIDWLNGRRYPNPSDTASAALVGLRIGHDAVDIYRALVTSAVMGSLAIYDKLKEAGIGFERMILVGGIGRKSPFVCQMMSDALGVEAMVAPDMEVCAKGAAVFAAVAVGVYPDVATGQRALCPPFNVDYSPDPAATQRYREQFDRYQKLGQALDTDQ